MVIPQRKYHEYGNVAYHHRYLVQVEQRPHYQHSGHNSHPACETVFLMEEFVLLMKNLFFKDISKHE